MSEQYGYTLCDVCNRFHDGECPPALTGGSSDYYSLRIDRPTHGGEPYTVECNDIIETLGMTFAEGNVLKAVWRHALARRGNGKPGNTALYDAEKIEYYGRRLVEMDRCLPVQQI